MQSISGCHSQLRQKYDGHWSSLYVRFICLLSQDISLTLEPVARDLCANIQCVGVSVVPLPALLINVR